MEIKDVLHHLSSLIDSCYIALTKEEQEEITKIEIAFENYLNSKTKYVVMKAEEPICVCDTLADAEEAILVAARKEAYEAYLWDVEDFATSYEEFLEDIMKYAYFRNKSLEFNILAAWGFDMWIKELETY